MSQLTIRGFDKDIEREIRKIAKKNNVSLNKAALQILQQGVRPTDHHLTGATIGSSLDHLAGNWSEEDVRAMNEIEKDFEQIDSELWT
jgi:hypothetical protein